MKKIILTLGLMLGMACAANAQQPISSQAMVGITPAVSDNLKLPEDAKSALGLKLTQMATQNGFGSTSGRFALTANVVTTGKETTATAPVQFVVSLEVSFYVVDVIEQTIIDEISISAKGINRLENKAAIQAINSINVRTPQMRKFMNGVREKIVDYYSTRVPVIVRKAETYAEMDNYDMALYTLADIPETVDEYPMVLERMTDIYNKKIDKDVTAAIGRAKALVAAGENRKAVDELLKLDSYGNHTAEVDALVASIKDGMTLRQQQEFEMRKAGLDADKVRAEAASSGSVVDNFMGNLDSWFSLLF